MGAECVESSGSETSRPRLTQGVRIGRYVLLRKVGSGGMGVVYAAYDPQLDRRVALKVLKGDGFDPARSSRGQAQLVREAQAMARLSHTNVVTVHDVGTLSDNNMVFVAMEFIEGVGLRQWWESKPRSWRETVDVFIQAGEGLAAAHDAGVVHRDFKPDNVLVGDDGRVVVTDFGLARRMETAGLRDPDEEDTTLAAAPIPKLADHGTLGQAGTPAYMAPETHLGRRPGAAGDQFSFALTLYEALYGAHPFAGTDPVSLATSVMEDTRRARVEDVRLPPRIRRAIDRALCHNPDRRWPDMRPFLDQLAATRRPRGALWVATGVGLCALGLGMVTTSDPRPYEAARDHLADSTVVGQADRTVDGSPPLHPCSDPEQLRLAHEPPSPVQAAVVEAANARLSRAEALFNAGLVRSAGEAAQSAVELANKSGYPPVQARAALEAGTLAAAAGDVDQAEAHLRNALGASRLAGDEAVELKTWLQLQYVVGVLGGRPDEAQAWAPVVRALLDRTDAPAGDRATFESTLRALEQATGNPSQVEPP